MSIKRGHRHHHRTSSRGSSEHPPIEDLQQHVAQLVVGVVGEGGRQRGEQLHEGREEHAQEVGVLRRVHQLDALAHLRDQRQALLRRCAAGVRASA